MPLIEITSRTGVSFGSENPFVYGKFRRSLQESVAKHLSCTEPGGQLEPDHVTVIHSLVKVDDFQKPTFLLKITANFFPARAANAKERLAAIVADVKVEQSKFPPNGMTYAFWLLLPKGEYEELAL